MNIALFGKNIADPVIPVIQELVDHMQLAGGTIFIYRPLYNSLQERMKFLQTPEVFDMNTRLGGRIDFLFSIGGDGTILDSVRVIGDSEIPVAGINMGRLGFLSGISREKIMPALAAIERGDFLLEKRTLLQLESPAGLFGETNFALNELTVYKPNVTSILTIKTWINGEFLNTYWGDGLIVATPTGSTAYSLSCTGPIVTPDNESFVITPIANHNLTVRPIVVRDDCEIRIRVEGKEKEFLISLDSRFEKAANPIELVIRKAGFKIHLLRLSDTNFYQTIREKLNWGLDNRN